MSGFKNFLLRGNLVEIAVGLIMAASFGAVVTAFTDMLMGFIGKIGGQPNFNNVTVADVNVGIFITAVVSFVILAAVVYFLIVTPYVHAKERFFPEESDPEAPSEVALLTEIRDALVNR
ncbi:MscL family protein [Nocardioides sp. GY 10113]|uniref:MscL family protein n=1 Tax=Nocardioides sp. GY 10113 TaxID=2569761 RepID=UPI0010A8DAE6|nr:MscL family protein [Nocardioides sp. GY 10113]TIC88235.1 MscL family protein [Nocardioides sp. GY 10113]